MAIILGKIRLLFTALLALLLFTGCSASNELTVKNKKLSEDELEQLQITNGFNGVYFEFGGEIPADHRLTITLDQYEKGEFVSERASFPLEGSFDENNEVRFGSILESDGDSNEATLLVETPGGGFTAPVGEIKGAFSWAEMIDKTTKITVDKPVYLAFWISDEEGRVLGEFTEENDYADLKNYDQCFLLKVELAEI